MPKKRSPGDGGLYYVRQQNLWRGVVDVGYGPDGRRKQKSVTARTQRAAREKLDELKAEIAQYGAPLDKTMTVTAWSDHWLKTVCAPRMKPVPLRSYESLVRNWVVPTIGKKRVALLKPSDIRAATKAVTDAGRSSSTALSVHNLLSAMLESARLDGLVARNVVRDVVAPRAAKSNRGALESESAFAVLAKAAEQMDGTRWWFAILAGMRQGERLGATLDSVDFETGTFTVQWSLTEASFEHGCADDPCGKKKGGSCPSRRLKVSSDLEYRHLDGRLCLVRPKSGKPRTFSMPPVLAEPLRRYLDATKDMPNPHGLIWRNPDGSPMTAEDDNDAWRALLLAAGQITVEQAKPPRDRKPGTPTIPTTHWARHTTATVLMELGVDARIVGEIVGHASTRVTDRYQHVSSTAAATAMTAIGAHFAKALED